MRNQNINNNIEEITAWRYQHGQKFNKIQSEYNMDTNPPKSIKYRIRYLLWNIKLFHMCLLPRMFHKYSGSMWYWSQLGERILDGAEISLIQDDINWHFKAQRESKHFSLLHLNPPPLLHALNSMFWNWDLACQPSVPVPVCGPLACHPTTHITGRASFNNLSWWQAPLSYPAWKVGSYQCFICFPPFYETWFLCSLDYEIITCCLPCIEKVAHEASH